MSLATTSEAIEPKRHRIDSLTLLAGVVILLDSVWGGIATLGLDWSRTNELVMGISFVLGIPMYLLDVWINKRIAICLLGLFFFRWVARCFGGSTPVLCNPWSGSLLLILAFALLQWSKLRSKG
jgi:hypothetical protein